jgi:2,4-dienoyl-CoA reductase-like NADH-dependent reductase (Old Yellow Enzyme family)
LLRVSATDWVKGGFTPDETVAFCSAAKALGIDMVGVSTAGNAPLADYENFKIAPGYQVPFAQQIRTAAQVPTYAVGLISEPQHAESILLNQQADAIALARAMLRDPYWPRHAARALGVELAWPNQYARCEVDAFGRKV